MATPSPCFGPIIKTVLPDESLTCVLRISVPSLLIFTLHSAMSFRWLIKVISKDLPLCTGISAGRLGRSLEITLISQRKDMAECRVKIKSEGTDILNTQVRLYSGRTVLIVGPKHGEGVAIIALSARF